jgi:hypothetical protein
LFARGSNEILASKLSGHEQYLDRNIDLQVKEFRLKRHLQAIEDLVVKLFDTDDFESQPHYIADMACGDGSLLYHLHEAIRLRSRRGQVLDRWPLTLIGADLHASALQATAKTLVKLPHELFIGDVSEPQNLLSNLKRCGVKPDEVLHVRAFLDHDLFVDHFFDRDLHATVESSEKFALRPSGVYIDAAGAPVASYDVVRHWRAHLERWSSLPTGHGLVVAEVHCLNAAWTQQNLQQSPSLHHDHVHALASQYLIDAELFLVLAANVGLFSAPAPQRHPQSAPYTNMTLSHFRKRDYRVRHAHMEDLFALCRLEERCRTRPLRTPVAELRRRISEYPQGQFVLEWHDRIVGVIYSQRIENTESIAGLNSDTVQRAHRANGTVVQLLAINVLPSLQSLQSRLVGDELLEFMLQRCSVMNGVDRVVAITLCKAFRQKEDQVNDAEFHAYISQKDDTGRVQDPVLRFHQRHGARIGAAVPDYRPQDKENLGYGVWVHYDLATRTRDDGEDLQESVAPLSAANLLADADIDHFLQTAVTSCLGPERSAHYSPDLPLIEMGLESSTFAILCEKIRYRYGWKLPTSFFLLHGTPAQIVEALHTMLEHRQTAANTLQRNKA